MPHGKEEAVSSEKLLKKIVALRHIKLRPLAILVDSCIVVNAYALASLLLFARWAPLQYYNELLLFLPVAVVTHCAINQKLGLYSVVGRYAGLYQGIRISRASFIAAPIIWLSGTILMPSSFLHVTVMVPIGEIITFILMAGVRFYPRIFYEHSLREIKPRMHTMVVGAGAAGEMIVRSIQMERHLAMDVVIMVDDNPEYHGFEIHGVPINGPTERIPELVAQNNVDEIVIAIPSASLEQFQRIWRICSRTQLAIKTVRPLQSMNLEQVGIGNIRDVEIEDLLGRQPILTDYSQISEFLHGKIVMITGAGGSIGSELALQICQHQPALVVLLDRDETALYQIHERLAQKLLDNYELSVCDVQSEEAVESVFLRYRPQLVFHAAAYKHVPLMEMHPHEAVLNNVMGTWNTASKAGIYGADCFVNISTDKAVEPVNVMGACKQMGERLVHELGDLYPTTRYCSVRFGNVLGSRGSVIPIFRQQILNGSPVTITHPEMRRYFMLISEAVGLVLQASAFPEGDASYVLEMGQQVRILDLARQMISFLSPDKPVDIIFTGLRPGEKINEKLLAEDELREPTKHPMIFRVFCRAFIRQIQSDLPELFRSAMSRDNNILDLLANLANGYAPLPEAAKVQPFPAAACLEDLDLRPPQNADVTSPFPPRSLARKLPVAPRPYN